MKKKQKNNEDRTDIVIFQVSVLLPQKYCSHNCSIIYGKNCTKKGHIIQTQKKCFIMSLTGRNISFWNQFIFVSPMYSQWHLLVTSLLSACSSIQLSVWSSHFQINQCKFGTVSDRPLQVYTGIQVTPTPDLSLEAFLFSCIICSFHIWYKFVQFHLQTFSDASTYTFFL